MDVNAKQSRPLSLSTAGYRFLRAALWLAAFGCAEPDAPERATRASLTTQSPAPEVDSRGVSLPVSSAGAVARLAATPAFDADRLTKAILDADGPGSIVTETASDHVWRGRVGRKAVDVDTLDGRILIRDDRAYDEAGPRADPDAAELVARARPLLSALGVSETEMTWRAGAIGSQMLEESTGAVGKTKRLANKLHIRRMVLGLPVAGNHLVVSFALDGTLRKVLGRWHKIDHGIVQVADTLTAPGVVQQGLALVEARRQSRHTRLRAGMPIRVSTQWIPIADSSGGWKLALYGKVGIPGAVEDSYRWTELDFALEK